MKNIINASELQRKGLKSVSKVIEKYGKAIIINQRSNKQMLLIDKDNPYLLVNIIKNLKAIKNELKQKYKVEKIGIFGSFVKGNNKDHSDLDLLIKTNKKDLHDLFSIEDFIKKNLKISKIDLFSFKNISSLVWKNIEEEIIYV